MARSISLVSIGVTEIGRIDGNICFCGPVYLHAVIGPVHCVVWFIQCTYGIKGIARLS